MKPPYFPFYVLDFAADPLVEAMSTEAVGAYVLLLCKAWHCDPPASIPDDDKVLAKWARVTAKAWAKLRDAVLSPFEKRGDGRLYQRRLEAEFQRFLSRSASAKKAADTRWGKDASALRPHSDGIASGMQRAYGSGSGSGSEGREGESEGEGPERGSPEGPPEPLRSSLRALDDWAAADRGHPLNRVTGEAHRVAAFLEAMEGSPPVLRGSESLPVASLVPLAVQVLLGQAKPPRFKSVAWALACVRTQLEEWQAGGLGKIPQTADQRWEEMRAANVVSGPRPDNGKETSDESSQ